MDDIYYREFPLEVTALAASQSTSLLDTRCALEVGRSIGFTVPSSPEQLFTRSLARSSFDGANKYLLINICIFATATTIEAGLNGKESQAFFPLPSLGFASNRNELFTQPS